MYSKVDCLKPVRENLHEIRRLVQLIADEMKVKVEEIFVFQSRGLGTCNPNSDIDIYIQFSERLHFYLMNTTRFKNSFTYILSRESVAPYFNKLGEEDREKIGKLKLDLFWGMSHFPPTQKKYLRKKHYVSFSELEGRVKP